MTIDGITQIVDQIELLAHKYFYNPFRLRSLDNENNQVDFILMLVKREIIYQRCEAKKYIMDFQI